MKKKKKKWEKKCLFKTILRIDFKKKKKKDSPWSSVSFMLKFVYTMCTNVLVLYYER